MHALDVERYDGAFARRRAVNPQAVDRRETFGRAVQQRLLVPLDLFGIEALDEFHRFAERDGARKLAVPASNLSGTGA